MTKITSSLDIKRYYETIFLIDKFLDRQKEILNRFFSEETSSFFRQKPKKEGISLTSTITCLISLKRSEILEKFKGFNKNLLLKNILEMEKWTSADLPPDNGYTLSLLFPGLRLLLKKDWQENLSAEQVTRISNGLKKLEDQLSGTDESQKTLNLWEISGIFISISKDNYPPNSFLTFWALKSLDAFGKFEKTRFKHTYHWAIFTFHREIANYNSNNLEEFDVFELAYSFIILKRFYNHYIPVSTTKHTLEIIFKNQNELGRWNKGHPLFHYPGAGNAYCHDFEMIRTLLEVIKETDFDILVEFFPNLRKALTWVDANYKGSIHKDIAGWSSGHHPQWPYPESWATAAVFDFLFEYKQILQKRTQNLILHEFGYYEGNLDDTLTLNKFLDSRIKFRGQFYYLIREILNNVFKEGFKKEKLSNGIIFCGPPGTGKTSLAKSIAKTINWRFIDISPGKFIEKNLWTIGENTREIFEKVYVLDRVVILFDELDELVRRRGSEADMLSRFITTTILPHFQKLAQQKKVIFIIATNHIKEFDPAIQRPGRFDLILNVNQPARSEILKKFNEVLKDKISERTIQLFTNFLEWQFNREILLDLMAKSEHNEEFLKFVQNNLIFKEEYLSDSLFEKFLEVISNHEFSGDWIDRLKSKIDEIINNDGYINFETDEQIEEYRGKFDTITGIFNRFTYSEIRPFVENELLEVLKNVPIDSQQLIEKFKVYSKGMTLTILFENFFQDIKKNKVYWRTQNRINVPINNK